MDEETKGMSFRMNINLLNHTAFLLSFNHVSMLLEDPDYCSPATVSALLFELLRSELQFKLKGRSVTGKSQDICILNG